MNDAPHASEVVPRVWLGDYHASQDETFLRGQHIDVVFNCTKDIPFSSVAPVQYRVPLHDNLEEVEINNAALWSPEIALTITRHYREGKRILIHCFAGRQRSAACLAMFLILEQGLRANQAISFIRSKRPIAFHPSANFQESIEHFDAYYQTQILPRLTGLNA